MDKYGESAFSFSGMNEHTEVVFISVFKDKIVAATYQGNGWVRKNIYHRDGTREKFFGGKWNLS